MATIHPRMISIIRENFLKKSPGRMLNKDAPNQAPAICAGATMTPRAATGPVTPPPTATATKAPTQTMATAIRILAFCWSGGSGLERT